MLKSQIAIIIVSIISLVFIFRLPKVIVADNKPEKNEENIAPYVASQDNKETHKVFLSEKEKVLVENLKNQLSVFSDNEKKIIFADSIASLYKSRFIFDSSAVYYEMMTGLNPVKENLLKTGQAYYDAFMLSANPSNKANNNKAREFFQKALDLDPDNPEIVARLAMTYVASEDPMKGIVLLREILEKDPDNETAIYTLGTLSVQTGQYDKAIERFSHVLRINPGNANACFYLGVCYAEAGNKVKAIEFLEKAKELEADPAFRATVDSYLNDIRK